MFDSLFLLCYFVLPVSWKSEELFEPEKPVVKQQSACFEKLSFHMLLEKTRGLQNRLKKFRDLW